MMVISPFHPDHGQGVQDVVLTIQRDEFGIPITLEEQPDLMDIPGFCQRGKGNFSPLVDCLVDQLRRHWSDRRRMGGTSSPGIGLKAGRAVVQPVPASDQIQKRLNGSSVLAKAKADGKFMGRKPTAFEKSEEVGRLATEGDIGRSASVALRAAVSWGPSQNIPSK